MEIDVNVLLPSLGRSIVLPPFPLQGLLHSLKRFVTIERGGIMNVKSNALPV